MKPDYRQVADICNSAKCLLDRIDKLESMIKDIKDKANQTSVDDGEFVWFIRHILKDVDV